MRLPDDCLVKTDAETRRQVELLRSWTTEHELLAQLVEEVGILAAEHRRKQPVKVPRPDHLRKRPRREAVRAGQPDPGGFARAARVLMANARPSIGRG